MKCLLSIFLFFSMATLSKAQGSYDSVTISRFLISETLLGNNWNDTLEAGRYPVYLANEKTIWRKPSQPQPRSTGVTAPVFSLTDRIRRNGTADIAKCFIPRHTINFYKQGKITRFLQVCFECDGVRLSDDPPNTFIKNVSTREKQIAELKTLFKDLL